MEAKFCQNLAIIVVYASIKEECMDKIDNAKDSEKSTLPQEGAAIEMPDNFTIPDPQKLQAELEELVKNKYGDKVKIVSQELGPMPGAGAESNLEDEQKQNERYQQELEQSLDFNFLPKEIVEDLDKYVIKQELAKKSLSIAICDHYNHVKKDFAGECEGEDNYSKQNLLVLGPTGVGKTYLVKRIAKLLGVPFVKADATRFTESGYVGSNVDDLVRDLVAQADGNMELAQYGIIYLDEVDKIAGSSRGGGKDVSGRGVQNGLLKLMEESEIDLHSPTDMVSQFQAVMDLQRTGKVTKKLINTKHILFIVSGAFSGLEDIIKKRLKMRTIGLVAGDQKGTEKVAEENLFAKVMTQDLINFGLEPEFIGRLPVHLSCHHLSVDDLFHILLDAKGSIIGQYVDSFAAYGITIKFEKSGLKRIAEMAYEEGTGARAFMSVLEKIFREFKFELPSSSVKSFKVTKALVNNPQKALKDILAKV